MLTAVSEATENDEQDMSRDFNCENDESFNLRAPFTKQKSKMKVGQTGQ